MENKQRSFLLKLSCKLDKIETLQEQTYFEHNLGNQYTWEPDISRISDS